MQCEVDPHAGEENFSLWLVRLLAGMLHTSVIGFTQFGTGDSLSFTSGIYRPDVRLRLHTYGTRGLSQYCVNQDPLCSMCIYSLTLTCSQPFSFSALHSSSFVRQHFTFFTLPCRDKAAYDTSPALIASTVIYGRPILRV